MSMRNAIKWVTAALLAAAMAPAVAQDKVVLKMGLLGTTDYFYYKGAKRMADLAAERSRNRIEIQLFPNQGLGNERDMIEGMQLGTVDLAVINTPLLASFDQRFMLFDMPFLFNDWNHVNKVLSGKVGQQLMKALESKGLKAFAFSTAGFRHVVNQRRPVRTPDDLRGLKIRTLDNPVHVAIMNAMGANATPMQYGEVSTALRQGTIDGLDFQLGSSATEKMYEVNKHMALTGHVFTGVIYLMSLKRYQGLPADLQKIVAETAVVGANTETELYNKFEADARGILEKNGMTVLEVDKAPFRARTASVYERFQGRVGKDLIDMARRLGQ
jgi:tripartite ATP-independent transporter DctP family solute receptor